MTKLGERVVTASDGRELGIAEWGTPHGVPVVWLHGTPGSRLMRHHDEAMYERLGMHVVTYDRPGYGLSDRHRGRIVVDAVADVASVADALGFDRFVVGGGSGGSPHALACAARLRDRIRSAYLFVPVAPYDALGDEWMAGQSPSNVEEWNAVLAGEEVLFDYLAAEVAKMRGDVMSILSAEGDVTASDREVMARESVQLVFREGLSESIRQGPIGWLDDDLAFLRPWGFDIAEVRVPALVAYGRDDTLAPRAHGEYVAGAVRGAEVVVMESGHLSAMDYSESNWSRVLEMAAVRP
jgi:pimeloyl-ACP methyl ester carboxylesterase